MEVSKALLLFAKGTLQQKYHLCNNKYSKTESSAMFELRNGGY